MKNHISVTIKYFSFAFLFLLFITINFVTPNFAFAADVICSDRCLIPGGYDGLDQNGYYYKTKGGLIQYQKLTNTGGTISGSCSYRDPADAEILLLNWANYFLNAIGGNDTNPCLTLPDRGPRNYPHIIETAYGDIGPCGPGMYAPYVTAYWLLKSVDCIDNSIDTDNDEVSDCEDNCPWEPNSNQADINGNDIGDICELGADIYSGQDCQLDKDSGSPKKLNPVNIFNGNNIESKTDISFSSPFEGGLSFKRFYNSQSVNSDSIGYGWTHNYNILLSKKFGSAFDYLKILDDTGRGYYFQKNTESTAFEGLFSEETVVTTDSNGDFIWALKDGSSYLFDQTSGQLISITDANGNVQTLTYNANNLLETITDAASGRSLTFNYNANNKIAFVSGPVTSSVPDGIWITYTYDANDNLTRVEYADDGNGSTASGFEYRYEDTDVHNITSKYDLAGTFISSWQYDANDKAIANDNREGKGGTINYDDPNEVVVTDAYGIATTHSITEINGRKKITMNNKAGCASCSSGVYTTQYDETTGIPVQREYFNGRIDQYQGFDTNLNPETTILASGTQNERTIYKTYHLTLNTPLTITEPSVFADTANPDRYKAIIYDYDDPADPSDTANIPNENPSSLVYNIIKKGYSLNDSDIVASYEYVTKLEYNSKGQVVSIDGPLPGTSDTSTLSYNPTTGDLLSITNPVIGSVALEYDNAGNITKVTDQNNTEILLTYDGKNRQISSSVNGKTSIRTYTASGDIATDTDKAGITMNYAYNVKGFLERITNPAGEYASYSYDANGNPTEQSMYSNLGIKAYFSGLDYGDPATNPDLAAGKPYKAQRRNPDDTADLETIFTYENGKLIKATDPVGNFTEYTYDLLNRVTLETKSQTDLLTTSVQYEYDTQNNLTKINDANNNATSFTFDDDHHLIKLVSPDTGTTRFAYDEAGNLTSKKVNTSDPIVYNYDLAGRLTSISYSDTLRDITYTYDQGANSKGRLTSIADPSGTYAYTYHALGQPITETKTISGTTYTTGYNYDDAGNLLSITYPSGRVINYLRDSSARITQVNSVMISTTQILAQNITHLPFGPVKNLTYGNSKPLVKTFDTSYLPKSSSTTGVLDNTFTLNDAGRVTNILDAQYGIDQTYIYNDAYQLTNAENINEFFAFTYDLVNNRQSKTKDTDTEFYFYFPDSNKLKEISGGDHQTTTVTEYEYTLNERLKKITQNGTILGEYEHNSFGQRTSKTINSATTIYHYDISGLLIAESLPNGTIIKEYVYLNSQPLAMIIQNNFYFYHNDHLGTPKILTDILGTIVWQASHTPFGLATITINTIENNLRFPGQYL